MLPPKGTKNMPKKSFEYNNILPSSWYCLPIFKTSHT